MEHTSHCACSANSVNIFFVNSSDFLLGVSWMAKYLNKKKSICSIPPSCNQDSVSRGVNLTNLSIIYVYYSPILSIDDSNEACRSN